MIDLCIYHADCLDGFAAAWAVHRALPNAEFVAAQHGSPPPANIDGREIVIVDFSYKRPVLIEMASRAKSILILDHHKTAAEDLSEGLPENVSVHFDMEHSGCVLAWQHFHPGVEVPDLLLHVEDRDLWRFHHVYTRVTTAALGSLERDFSAWDAIVPEYPHSLAAGDRFRAIGWALCRVHDEQVASAVKNARPMKIGGFKVQVANAPHFLASDVGHALAADAPFGATYFDAADARVFSLRSTDAGEDVSAIAKLYGGGGHRNAAGFRVPFTHALAQGEPSRLRWHAQEPFVFVVPGTVNLDPNGLNAYGSVLPEAPDQPTSIDVEQMLRDCIPGGSICDPQQIADAIREWFEKKPSVADGIEQRARELLDSAFRELGLHEDAYRIGCGSDDLEPFERASISAIAAGLRSAEQRDETPVEIFPGLPGLPKWVHDYAAAVERYMTEHHPGYWAINGISKRCADPGKLSDSARLVLEAPSDDAPRKEGCTCESCGKQYIGDLLVPDDVWSRIVGDEGLLCARCILDRVVAAGIWTAARATDVDAPREAAPEPAALSRHSRAMLLNVLWHHQGGSSAVGQSLRTILGVGRNDHLDAEQVSEAKWIDGLLANAVAPPAPHTNDAPREAAQEPFYQIRDDFGLWRDVKAAAWHYWDGKDGGPERRVLYTHPAPQQREGASVELPDSIRVPLDELWADAGYSFGRVATDGSCAPMFVADTRSKIEAAKVAIFSELSKPAPLRSVTDADVLRAVAAMDEAVVARHGERSRISNLSNDDRETIGEAAHAALESFRSRLAGESAARTPK